MTVNWNRWGKADERGALNLITAEKTLAAAGLVREGRVFELAQPIFPGMNIPGHRAGVMHFMGRDGGDYAAGARQPGGFQFAEDTLVMPLHAGTHMDALCHCWHDDRLYNGFPQNGVRSRGAERLGIEKAGPVVTRGILLDFVKLCGQPLDDARVIGAELLAEAIVAAETDLQPGDAVLLRTGWMEQRGAAAAPDYNAEPGIDLAAAEMLSQAGVALVGADNFAVEVLPFPDRTVFPVHQHLIRDSGIPLLENLVLAPLADAGCTAFMFAMAALPIRGATASPVNPMAIL